MPNVGIGTTAPSTKLGAEVSDASTTQATAGWVANFSNADQTAGNWLGIALSDGQSGPATATIQTKFTDHTNNYGELHLGTRGAGGWASRLVVDENGNVGIGNTNPSSILDVNGAYTQRGMAAPAVSNSGEGRIYFDSTANKFKVSQHGGGYVDLVPSGGGVGGSGTSGKIPKFTASGTIGDSILADTGTGLTVETNLLIDGAGAGGHSYITNNAADISISSNSSASLLKVGYNGDISATVAAAQAFFVKSGSNTKLTLDSGGGANLWSMNTDYTANGNLNISQTAGTQGSVIANRSIASTTNPIASGAAIDLSTSNTHTLASVGGSTITLSNMVDGGVYNIAIEDTTSRTYTFSGCTNSYYKPANAATTAATRTIYGVMTVKKGANWDCYVTWSTGFQ